MTLICLGAGLIWLVITHSVAAYLATSNPATALLLNPGQPVALTGLARQAWGDGETSRALELAESALRADPTNADALSLLGEIADAAGDLRQAASFMAAAVHRTLHESVAVHRMMRERLRDADYSGALRLADALFRTRPDLIDVVAPTFVVLAQDAALRPHLIARLSSGPPWRAMFLARLCSELRNPSTMLDVLLDLQGSPTPPRRDEVNIYLDFLVERGHRDRAYAAWLQLLPPDRLEDARLLFNGSFRDAPSGSPFDWRIATGAGVIHERVDEPNDPGLRALKLTFGPGRVELGEVAQRLVLPPGRYRFSGRQKIQLTGRRGLQWRLTCSGREASIASSEPAVDTDLDWGRFELAVVIPATGCRTQMVRLELDARFPSVRTIAGTAAFTHMQIIRDPAR